MTLNEFERRIARLWACEHLNTAEIAKRLGMKESTIDRLRPARLATQLHEETRGDEPT